ncbi:MAG: oligoendopeptidase F [Lachnospiraceae bacterium]|nr:oligoendopeptidase F [Lachnospiraceae bacterium]
MGEIEKLPARSEIAEADKWALEDLFLTDADWEAAVKQLEEQLAQLKGYAGKVSASADALYAYLTLADETENLFEKVLVYSNEKMHEDMGNSTYQGYAAQAQAAATRLSAAEAFFEPELLAMEESRLQGFLKEDPKLEKYRLLIDRIWRRKEHTLSAAEEEILAKTYEMATAPDDIFSMFNDADAKFGTIRDENGKEVELTHGRFGGFMESSDRRVRKEAFEALYQTYDQFKNTLAATYSANVKKAKFYADVRKYPSALAAALAPGNIPTEVYDNLIETVHRFLPAMYRYVALRKRALGVEELHMYDVYVPLVADQTKKIPFAEAKEIVKRGLAPMGEEYVSHLEEGFDHRWIDVYENRGKRSGAYSWGAYGTHPYVLLNYQGKLDDVFTLAHEMGHALHSWYSNANQPYVYSGYLIFVAEVASTCNESLLMQYLLKESKDKKEKAYLLNHFIDQFKGTLFRQTMFAEFEKITHEMYAKGESLTAERLCAVYMDLNRKYFGEEMVSDPQIALEWARIPHFYTEFYVYQYATGFSCAIALSKRILEMGEAGVADYMKFLKGGCSKDPIELLKMAGVDISTPKPVEDALQLFEELVSELEELL